MTTFYILDEAEELQGPYQMRGARDMDEVKWVLEINGIRPTALPVAKHNYTTQETIDSCWATFVRGKAAEEEKRLEERKRLYEELKKEFEPNE